MSLSPLLDQLERALRCLPGVGQRTASRMALHLLERNRAGGLHLALALEAAMTQIGECQQCAVPTEDALCQFCADTTRDHRIWCVVCGPADVQAIEQSGLFQGKYHCLRGTLSPLDGRGPEDIGLPNLYARIEAEQPSELIIALPSTVEGEATTFQIQATLGRRLRVTRLAQGVPVGGDLGQLDATTLSHALLSRTEVPS